MIVSLSMVQSEADIIEYFIRSNLRLLDHMFIVTNPSEDGTNDIIEHLILEGLPITVWPTPRNHYAQSEIIGPLANLIRDRFDPDHLCLIDADEILLVDNKDAFQASLERMPTDHVGLAPWATFVPPGNEHAYSFCPTHWTERLDREIKQYYKLIIPRGAAAGEVISIPSGQHYAMRAGGEGVAGTILSELSIAHLPVRSVSQIRAKTLGTILSKILAVGPSWIGRESHQTLTVLSYLEAHEAPDLRQIAGLYLADDWAETNIPSFVTDLRLPKDAPTLNNLIKHMSSDLHLFYRILFSVASLSDLINFAKG